jgi:hypothetical protein
MLIKLFAFWIVVSTLWFLFTFLMPQIWPEGPVNIIHPGYWMFTLTLFTVRVLFNVLFRSWK